MKPLHRLALAARDAAARLARRPAAAVPGARQPAWRPLALRWLRPAAPPRGRARPRGAPSGTGALQLQVQLHLHRHAPTAPAPGAAPPGLPQPWTPAALTRRRAEAPQPWVLPAPQRRFSLGSGALSRRLPGLAPVRALAAPLSRPRTMRGPAWAGAATGVSSTVAAASRPGAAPALAMPQWPRLHRPVPVPGAAPWAAARVVSAQAPQPAATAATRSVEPGAQAAPRVAGRADTGAAAHAGASAPERWPPARLAQPWAPSRARTGGRLAPAALPLRSGRLSLALRPGGPVHGVAPEAGAAPASASRERQPGAGTAAAWASSPQLVWRGGAQAPAGFEPMSGELPAPGRRGGARAAAAGPMAPHAAAAAAWQAAPALAAAAAPVLDAALVNRLADDVIRRIDKRLRIERERRGS